jgi:diguanylate cyclase (GGDEF)-like protein
VNIHRPRPAPAARENDVDTAGADSGAWKPDAGGAAEVFRSLEDCRCQLRQAQEKNAQLERQVEQLARAVAWERQHSCYDALTGLPNRRLLRDHFNQAAARGARQHQRMALLFLDLDGFKAVNDTLGHACGDKLLVQVAARLTDCVRTSDTVCRYGGDEFVVLLADIGSQERAVSTAHKIRGVIAEPYRIEQDVIRLTTSIGVAVCPIDGGRYEDLISRSDIAMYSDKSRNPAPHARRPRLAASADIQLASAR